MKIKTKMMTAFGLLITGIFAAVMIVLSLIVRINIQRDLEHQLNSTTAALSSVVFFMSTFLVKSIEKTTFLLKNISEGDGDLTGKLEIKSSDETGQMAGYFNNFTTKLAELIDNVKHSSSRSVQVREDLSVNLVETISSISQIDANLQSVNSRMKEMDGRINHSSSAVNRIIDNIGILDSQIQEQAGAVEESTAISGNVTNAVDEAAMGAAEISRNMQTSQNLLVTLSDTTLQVHREVAKFKTA